MGEINIPRDQQIALAAIDVRELDQLLEQAMRDERLESLRQIPLRSCGSYIATELSHFERDLVKYREAKSERKRAETADVLRRASHRLVFAVRAMQRRMETEKHEGQLFFVDDRILPPYRCSKNLSVSVNYRWRRTVNDEWAHGSIIFVHDVELRSDYTKPATKRKPSMAKREQALERALYETWESLMRGALYSVRDYFREGGDGQNIPATFHATVDPHTRVLNNYSTQFWRQRS